MQENTLPFYLKEKLCEANLLNNLPNSIDEVVVLFAKLKIKYPSLAWRGLYDLFMCINNSVYPDLEQQKLLKMKYYALPPIHETRSKSEVIFFMQHAINLAKTAYKNGEVPVGAIVVYENEIVGRGYNQTKHSSSNFSHAEIIALQEAEANLPSTINLRQCDMFVTLEPCLMCSGAIINSRLKRVYYAASEPKTGACCSQYNVFDNVAVNHQTEIVGGVMCEESTQLLQSFFQKLRKTQK